MHSKSHTQTPTPSLLRRIVQLFFALTALYSLIVSAFLLLRKTLTERWSLVGLFNVFAHLLLLPALPLFLVGMLWRRRWLTLAQAVPLGVFLTTYGRSFLPKHTTAASSDLSILTYNIHKHSIAHINSVIALIREANADIVALQELSLASAEVLSRRLADLYPYQALHPMDRAWCGQGILSRYPITADEYWHNDEFSFGLGHQRVEINFHETSITFYNTHPVHPGMTGIFFDTAPHRRETDILLERTACETSPVIIVGDFNMSDQMDDYRRIVARYHDTYREVGWGMGFTFPDLTLTQDLPVPASVARLIPNMQLLRLDYVFHDDDFQSLEARVWPSSGGSDHRPLFARLMLGRRP